jgi:hypothetical protein
VSSNQLLRSRCLWETTGTRRRLVRVDVYTLRWQSGRVPGVADFPDLKAIMDGLDTQRELGQCGDGTTPKRWRATVNAERAVR